MDALVSLLIDALLIGVIAFLAALILRMRQGVLAYVGAGFLGRGIGSWLFEMLHVKDPLVVHGVPVLATLVGAVLVFLIVKLIGRGGWRRRPA